MNYSCFNCGGVGHRQRDCPSARGATGARGPRGGRGGGRSFPYGRERSRRSSGNSSRRVYVNNLSWNTSWQSLKDHFRQAGSVEHAEIMTQGGIPGGRSKGCGIVEMSSSTEARRAIEELNLSQLDGREIFVREDREEASHGGSGLGRGGGGGGGPSQVGDPDCVIYVTRIPYKWSWQDLKDYFREAGDVVRADVLMNREGRSSGVGHVEYGSREDAQNAVDLLDGRDVDGLTLDVHFDKKR